MTGVLKRGVGMCVTRKRLRLAAALAATLLFLVPHVMACSCAPRPSQFAAFSEDARESVFESLEAARSAVPRPNVWLPANNRGVVADQGTGALLINLALRTGVADWQAEESEYEELTTGYAPALLVRPKGGFLPGQEYEAYSTDRSGRRVNYLHIGVLTEALGEGLIDVALGELSEMEVQIGGGAACAESFRVGAVDVSLTLPAAARRFRQALSYQTWIDGEPWNQSSHSCVRPAFGRSWRGVGRDLIVRHCEHQLHTLDGSEHVLTVRASLPGTDVVLSSNPVPIVIECASHALARTAFTPGELKIPELVRIEAGSLTTVRDPGDERQSRSLPPRELRVATPFMVSAFEVTFDEYDGFARATGRSLPSDEGWGRGRRPAINLKIEDAIAYAEWLSAQSGKRWRLLSEDEWEYVARAGSTTRFSWGDEPGHGNAICYDCASQWAAQTLPVGSVAPNAYGVFDMHGNAAEYVLECSSRMHDEDRYWWHAQMGEKRCAYLVRGGNALSAAREASASWRRVHVVPRVAGSMRGVRLARDI